MEVLESIISPFRDAPPEDTSDEDVAAAWTNLQQELNAPAANVNLPPMADDAVEDPRAGLKVHNLCCSLDTLVSILSSVLGQFWP